MPIDSDPTTLWKPDLDKIPHQKDFVYCDATLSAYVGGVRSGKTHAGAVKAFLYCVANPGADGLVTGPDYGSLTGATYETYRKVFPDSFVKKWQGQPAHILFTNNNNRILFRSTGEYETSLIGFTVAWAHMDEAAFSPPGAFDRVNARVSQPDFKHMIWITTTPRGFNWVHKYFPPNGLNPTFFASSRNNPFLGKDYVKRLLELYVEGSGKALQEIEGQYTLMGDSFFDSEALGFAMMNDVQNPIHVEENGMVQVWKHPELGGKYYCGVDPWGGGESEDASLAKTEIVNAQTGEQVLRLSGKIPADIQAKMTVEICRKYNNAFLVFENNNQGMFFAKALQDLHYGNIYYNDLKREKPGYRTDINKENMLLHLDKFIRERRIIVHSEDDLQEFLNIERKGEKILPAKGTRGDAPMALAMVVVAALARPHRPMSFAQPQSYISVR